nr:MAG TPA: hypothetical protein [Caudoviricetes sp.]
MFPGLLFLSPLVIFLLRFLLFRYLNRFLLLIRFRGFGCLGLGFLGRFRLLNPGKLAAYQIIRTFLVYLQLRTYRILRLVVVLVLEGFEDNHCDFVFLCHSCTSLPFCYKFECTVGAPVQCDELLTEADLRVRLHQHLEEVEFAGIRPLVNLNDVFVILQVDSCEKVAVHTAVAEGSDDQALRPLSQHLERNAFVAFLVDIRRGGTLIGELRQFIVVLVEVFHRHQDAQVRILTHGYGNLGTQFLETRQHGSADGFHLHHIHVLGSLRQDTVHQVGITGVFVFTVYILVAQLVAHLLQQFIQQEALNVGGKLTENEVARRLEGTPDVFESTGVEKCEGHHVFRHQLLLAVGKITLAVCLGRVFFALLQHGTRFHAGDADGTVNARNHHDKPSAHQFVAGSGKGEDGFQYFTTIVGGIQSLNCHCLFYYLLLVIRVMPHGN